jgi:hypothetical protein
LALTDESEDRSSLSDLWSSLHSASSIDTDGSGLADSRGGELVGDARGFLGDVGKATGS